MKIGRIIAIVIVALLLIGIALVDIRAAVLALVGLGVAFGVLLGLRKIENRRTRQIVGAVVAVVLLVSSVLVGRAVVGVPEDPEVASDTVQIPRGEGEEPAEVKVTVYQLALYVTPTSSNLTAFMVEPRLTVDIAIPGERVQEQAELALTPYEVPAETLGFLIREVDLGEYGGNVTVTIAGEEGELFVGNVPSILVLQDMPPGSFYDARDAVEVSREPYVNLETITLELQNLSRPIVFAIVRPPFAAFSGPIRPLLGAATLSDWFVGVVAIVTGLALWPIFLALVEERLEEELRNIFRGTDDEKK